MVRDRAPWSRRQSVQVAAGGDGSRCGAKPRAHAGDLSSGGVVEHRKGPATGHMALAGAATLRGGGAGSMLPCAAALGRQLRRAEGDALASTARRFPCKISKSYANKGFRHGRALAKEELPQPAPPEVPVPDVVIVPSFLALLQVFEPHFTAPSFRTFLTLACGWVLALGRHTVTSAVRAANGSRAPQQRHVHRSLAAGCGPGRAGPAPP